MDILVGHPISAVGFARNSSGVLTDADSLPTAALWHNGAVDPSVSVLVTHTATGTYELACQPPSYSPGDICQLVLTTTVSGVTTSLMVIQFALTGGNPKHPAGF